METALTALAWVIGALGVYFVGMFVLSAIVIGCGFYFGWKLTKG